MQSIARLPHIGLSTDPVAPATPVTMKAEIVKLPYMGPSPKDDTIGHPYPTEVIKTKRYGDSIRIMQQQSEELADPSDLFDRKITTIARLLGCDEAQATRIFLDRI